MVERKQSKPAVSENNLVTRIALVSGGFDMTCDEPLRQAQCGDAGLLNHQGWLKQKSPARI